MRLLIGFTLVTCLVHLNEASPQRYRRQTVDNPLICQDQDVCSSSTDICSSGDPDIVNTLCPVTCGGCVCEDAASTGGSCSSLVPGICTEDLGPTLCPKSCGFCKAAPVVATTAASDCVDQVIGIECVDLPYPCNDALGQVACKKFCNLCPEDLTTTTAATPAPTTAATDAATVAQTTVPIQSTVCANNPCLNGGICQPTSADTYTCSCPSTHTGVVCHIGVPATTIPPPTTPYVPISNGVCGDIKTTKTNMGCVPAEIVFMIEYSVSDRQWFSVDHEGDFIKALVDKWQMDDSHIRVGVVVYHDTVRESIHIGDYSSKENLKDKISSLTRNLRPSGDADLGKAIDYARQNSFVGSRPGVERILIPIVHQTESPEKERIVPAAERLKSECIGLLGIAVQGNTLDTNIVQDAVSKPTSDYYQYYSSYYIMEEAAKNYFTPDCSNV